MFFADRLTLDAPRRTKDGYLAVRAKAARTGVYQYSGHEVDPSNEHGLRDQATVNVLRDEKTVFDKKAAHSFIGKPITDDHPSEAVNSNNWRDHARGVVMGAEWQEGGYLAFDLLLTDQTAIDKVGGGKRELSNGYEATLEFGDFKADDGTACPVRQTSVAGNHVALVDHGRAGSACRIADAANCDAIPRAMLTELLVHMLADERTYTGLSDDDKKARQRREAVDNGVSQMATKNITFDGMPIEATDASEAAIRKLEGQLADSNTAKAAAETKVGELTATVATKDGEIAGLNAKLKDAEIGPAQLEKLVADRSAVIAKAKAIDPNVVTDGKSDAEIRAAVVAAKLGDAAPSDENGIAGAFAALTADAKVDPLRDALRSVPVRQINDAAVRDTVRAMQY